MSRNYWRGRKDVFYVGKVKSSCDEWNAWTQRKFEQGFNHYSTHSSLGEEREHTQRNLHIHTHSSRKWGIPATLLEYQGQRRLIFATHERLSKYWHTNTIATLPNVGIFTTLGTGVKQVVPSQGTLLGWWPGAVTESAVVSVGGAGLQDQFQTKQQAPLWAF